MEYQIALLKRLLKMIEDNEKEKRYFETAHAKISKKGFNDAYETFTDNEQRAWRNYGYKHSRSSIQRVRIELNKSMIEWFKGE